MSQPDENALRQQLLNLEQDLLKAVELRDFESFEVAFGTLATTITGSSHTSPELLHLAAQVSRHIDDLSTYFLTTAVESLKIHDELKPTLNSLGDSRFVRTQPFWH